MLFIFCDRKRLRFTNFALLNCRHKFTRLHDINIVQCPGNRNIVSIVDTFSSLPTKDLTAILCGKN